MPEEISCELKISILLKPLVSITKQVKPRDDLTHRTQLWIGNICLLGWPLGAQAVGGGRRGLALSLPALGPWHTGIHSGSQGYLGTSLLCGTAELSLIM